MTDLLLYFFSPAQPLGLLFNVAIFAVGAAAVVVVILGWRSLEGERESLARYVKSVENATSAQEFVSAARGLRAGSILLERLSILKALHELGDEVHHSSLAAAAVSRIDRELAFPRWAASVVVLLGLGGTLVGLSIAVWRAQGLVEAAVTQAEATTALIGTFSGLQTAFSTTLAGIIFAVVLGLLISRLRRRQGVYIEELERFTLERLLPRFRTSPALAMTQAVQKLAALEAQMDSSLREVIDQLHLRGRALSASVDEGLGRVFSEMQTRGVALAGTIDKSFADLTAETREGHSAVLAKYVDAHGTLAKFFGVPEAGAPTIAETLAALERAVEVVQEATTSYVRMVPALEEVIARQVDRQSRDLHETMHGYVGRLAEGIERQDAIVNEGLDGIRTLLPEFGRVVGESQRRQLEAIDVTLAAHTDMLRESLTDQGRRVQDLSDATRGLSAAAQILKDAGGMEDRATLRRIAESIEVSQKELVSFVRAQPRWNADRGWAGEAIGHTNRGPMESEDGRSGTTSIPEESSVVPIVAPASESRSSGGQSPSRPAPKKRSLLDRWLGRDK